MDKDSNAYTFLFAGGLVVIVGALLATASMGLKGFQNRNVKNAKMQDILGAINVNDVSRAKASDRFMEMVKKRIVLDSTGKVINTIKGKKEIDRKNDSSEAFNISPRSQLKNIGKGNINRFALFVMEKGGKEYYVIPMAGSGLWGPIWGYVSLKEDMNTIAGVVFDHDSETPGLGAEIASSSFQDKFTGKKVFEKAGKFDEVKVSVIKGSVPPNLKEHAVDGITGGTVTSHGVRNMMQRTLAKYKSYFEQQAKKAS